MFDMYKHNCCLAITCQCNVFLLCVLCNLWTVLLNYFCVYADVIYSIISRLTDMVTRYCVTELNSFVLLDLLVCNLPNVLILL